MNKHTAIFLAGSLIAGVANADDRNPLDATFIIDAGTFLMSTDMRVRVDGETRDEVGTDVDYDEAFGIGDFDRFRVDAMWRFASRHAVRALYFKNDRSATRTLDRTIEFDGEEFPINATLKAESEATVAQLSYQYAFLRRENYELAAGIGVHYVNLGLSLEGQGGNTGFSRKGEASTEAPLPVLGLNWMWRLPANFYVTAQAQYFYLDLDPYKGSLLDLKASAVWQFTDHVGIGVAYNDFGFRFDIDDNNRFDGRLRWNYGGLIAFASVTF